MMRRLMMMGALALLMVGCFDQAQLKKNWQLDAQRAYTAPLAEYESFVDEVWAAGTPCDKAATVKVSNAAKLHATTAIEKARESDLQRCKKVADARDLWESSKKSAMQEVRDLTATQEAALKKCAAEMPDSAAKIDGVLVEVAAFRDDLLLKLDECKGRTY